MVEKCRTSTERQIRESLLIESEDSRNLINNKSEWGQNPVPRQQTEFREKVWEKVETEGRQSDRLRDRRPEKTSRFEDQFSQRRKVMREERDKEKMSLALGQDTRLETLALQKTISEQEDLNQADRARLQGERQPARKRRRQEETEKREVNGCGDTQRDIRAMFRVRKETPGLVEAGSTSDFNKFT